MATVISDRGQRHVDRLERIWAERRGLLGWLSTTDHKRIGIMYFFTALAFFGALAWAFDSQMRWIGVLTALALAALVVWRGLRGGGEAMAVYAIVYATIAFDAGVIDLVHDDGLRFLYLLVSTPVAIVILFIVYRRLKERSA